MDKFDSDKKDNLRGPQYSTFLDPGLSIILKSINHNPDVFTTSSCSGLPYEGHRNVGYPFLGVAFRNIEVARRYAKKLRATGLDIDVLPDVSVKKYDGVWTVISIPGTRPNSEPRGRQASVEEVKRYWRTVQQILS